MAILPLKSTRARQELQGDNKDLDNQGVTGWVVNQDDDYVCIFNDRTGAEVNVSFLHFILLTFRPLLGRGFPYNWKGVYISGRLAEMKDTQRFPDLEALRAFSRFAMEGKMSTWSIVQWAIKLPQYYLSLFECNLAQQL